MTIEKSVQLKNKEYDELLFPITKSKFVQFEDGKNLEEKIKNIETGTIEWDNIEGKPESFKPEEHNHDDIYIKKEDSISLEWDNIKGKPEEFKPEKHIHDEYYSKDEPITINWLNIEGKPEKFKPEEHNHDNTYIKIEDGIAWDDIKDKPELGGGIGSDHNHDDKYSPLNHNHDTVYSNKDHNHDTVYSDKNHNHDTVYMRKGENIEWVSISNKPSTFTPEKHSHNEYASSDHSHSEYASSGHSHSEYASKNHSHSEYASSSHSHSEYAKSSHSHSGYLEVGGDRSEDFDCYDLYAKGDVTAKSGVIWAGTSRARFDCNGTEMNRVMANYKPDYAIRIAGSGYIDFVYNNQQKHQFRENGTKTGGSIELNGTTFGMSPVDSPQTLIEDVLFDIEVKEEGTEIKLDNIFKQTITTYAVFSSNGDCKIISKEKDSFKVKGYTGIVDFRVIGKRIGEEDCYFPQLTNFDATTEEEEEKLDKIYNANKK